MKLPNCGRSGFHFSYSWRDAEGAGGAGGEELRQGPPALCPAPQGSEVPASILRSQGADSDALAPRAACAPSLRPRAPGAPDRTLPIASLLRPPATQLRRHRPFDSWPLLGAGGLFRGRYLDAKRLRCNSLVVTSAQIRPRSGSGVRASSGAEVPEWEGI